MTVAQPPPPRLVPSSHADQVSPGALPPPPLPPSDATVVVHNVSKVFGSLVAVSDVSLSIRPGVTALLGPNGAGKSTLLRLMCGLTAPTRGTVWVAGGDPRKDAWARSRLGLVPQQDGVFERDKLIDFVRLAAVLSGVPDPDGAARQAIGAVELDPGIERPLGTFSKGMRQRAKIASALVHGPTVLFLDEPLNGLDPRQRRQMIDLFHRLGEGGRTVVVSSHVLEEVERFGRRVLVIAKGRLAAEGDFGAIRSLMDDQPLRYRVSCSNARQVAATLIGHDLVLGCTIEADDRLEIMTADAPRFRSTIAAVCRHHGARLVEVSPLDDDLESVFRYLVGPG